LISRNQWQIQFDLASLFARYSRDARVDPFPIVLRPSPRLSRHLGQVSTGFGFSFMHASRHFAIHSSRVIERSARGRHGEITSTPFRSSSIVFPAHSPLPLPPSALLSAARSPSGDPHSAFCRGHPRLLLGIHRPADKSSPRACLTRGNSARISIRAREIRSIARRGMTRGGREEPALI